MPRQHPNGATTLPRDFRFHHEEDPKTPEPSDSEVRQPSPPRHRMKIRKRPHSSSLQAPTEQFLAFVAAADMPLPTIELPSYSRGQDSEMPDRDEVSSNTVGLLAPQSYDMRAISPPKTPILDFSFEDGSSHRPDWSMSSPSPVDGYFRPTSASSIRSDMSDDSFCSGGRMSRPSDDGSCTSPESEIGDPFHFPVVEGKGKAVLKEPQVSPMILNGNMRNKTRHDAPWTKPQSDHLWATYMLYLQDPTVTPFRIGASAVPPEGVCYRVARESRRSWKGPRSIGSSKASPLSEKSGSSTPTLELPKVYATWPHSSGATRNHLRELCKTKNNPSVTVYRHFQSRSPTPFSKPIERTRLRTPEPFGEAFQVKDMRLGLVTSTAETMQPDGPLAQLATSDNEVKTPVTKSTIPPLEEPKPLSFNRARGFSMKLVTDSRLGSPFVARTYGPSSSKSINPYGSRSSPPRLHSDAGKQLRSPFDQSRSLNGIQKRRAQHSLDDELSPNGAIVRPSVLNEQLFGTPLNSRRVRSRGFSLGDEAFRTRGLNILHSPLGPSRMEFPTSPSIPRHPVSAPMLLPPPAFNPPRLGSPFSEFQTFPHRVYPEGSSTVRRSGLTTMHQSRRSIESFDFGRGSSLQSRLQNLEQRLIQIQEREAASKRQSSD